MCGRDGATVTLAVEPREGPQGGLVLGDRLPFGLVIGVPATEAAWYADPVLATHETTGSWGYVAGSWLSMKL